MKPRAGSFVEWSASKGTTKGRVVSVHTGKVPGVIHQATGSADAPMARVQLWAKSSGGWEATSIFIAQPVDGLTVIAELPVPAPATEAVAAGSFDEIRQQVRQAIADRLASWTGAQSVGVYVVDIGPGWAVYEVGPNWDDLWMIEYSIDGDEVALGDPVAVVKIIAYVPDDEPVTATAENSVERIEGRVLAAAGAADDGGRIFRVQIIAYGDSKNGRRYPESVMRAAAQLYEGAKAYDHHRTNEELATGTIAGLVGHYRNVTATGSGLEADLHLLPSARHTAEALDQTIANQAAGLPLLVGISHDVMTASKQIVDAATGRSIREVTAVLSVNSADVVADPAAGGQVTRMVAGGAGDVNPTNHKEKIPVTLKQLLELLRAAESAKRPDLLREHASVLEANGLTGDDAIRLAEALAPPAPAPTPAAAPPATVYARESVTARIVVDHQVRAAGFGDNLVETVLAELPVQFTEADLTAKLESIKRVAETLEKTGLAPTVGHDPKVTADEADKKRARLDAMFAGDFSKGYRSFKEAYLDITGRRPTSTIDADFNREILRESVSLRRDGERVEFDSQLRSAESVSTSTWGYILGDSITRRMVAEYGRPSLQTWRNIVSSIVPVNDFRTQRIDRMGGYGTLPAVNQGAPYQPLTTPGNEEATYAITKRGGTEDLTLETIANDDMRAIARIPTRLGLAAAQTLYRFVWDILDTNPTVYDSETLFAVAHANTDTTALSGAAMSVGRKKMRKHTSYGDSADVLSITPAYLVVCSDLEELAYQLCTSAVAIPSGAPVGAASDTPNLHQGTKPIVVDYWSSTTKWALVADPGLVPTIEVGFYQGREDPELFVQNDATVGSVFTADKVTYKVRHIYSGAVLDYRGFYRGNT